MKPQWPGTDVLLVPEGPFLWSIYFALRSWDPPMLRRWMNGRREVRCIGRPDLEDLERFMWRCDAPYEKRRTGGGGVRGSLTPPEAGTTPPSAGDRDRASRARRSSPRR